MTDVSNILNGYGVQLESKALGQFGAAVGDYAKQAGMGPLADIAQQSINNKGLTVKTLGGLASTFGLNNLDNILGTNKDWQSPKYAADLVKFAPKHRFIFKVKFIFNEPYSSMINREFMYVVKEVDKPTVHFEYEDVNMYNFKTKVLKSIKHEALNMSFHDDIQNKVLDFFNAYRLAYSPISSLNYNQASMFENSGMDFYAPGAGGVNSASMGILQNGNVNVLSHIEVIQVFAHGTQQNTFVFTNPKIEMFDFDNLSMESSEGNALQVSFAYDSLYVYSDVTTGTPSPAWGATDIIGNKEVGTRQQFGNQTMGGDVVGKRSSGALGGFADALGKPISAIASAFGSVQHGIQNVVSSATSGIGALTKTTLGSVTPAINHATAGLTSTMSGMFKSSPEQSFDAMKSELAQPDISNVVDYDSGADTTA